VQKFIFFLMGLIAMTAQAQVIKCTNPATGQATYSDQPCENGKPGKLVEQRKSQEEIMAERVQAAEANERKYRNRLVEMQIEQQAVRHSPMVEQQFVADKSSSYECRQAQKDHETVSSTRTGTEEERRNRINSSTVKVNAICGTKTELMQAPVRAVIIKNRGY